MDASTEELSGLVAQTALGNRGAFRELYDTTSPRVYAVLVRMLGERAEAQDVLQDTYIKIWAQAGDYHAERGEVLSWIIAIARYRALDLLRARGRRQHYEVEGGGALSAKGDAAESVSDTLQECLNQLADLQRRSIQAAFVYGLTHEELAARENTPLGTIKSRIRRGLQRLRECLER